KSPVNETETPITSGGADPDGVVAGVFDEQAADETVRRAKAPAAMAERRKRLCRAMLFLHHEGVGNPRTDGHRHTGRAASQTIAVSIFLSVPPVKMSTVADARSRPVVGQTFAAPLIHARPTMAYPGVMQRIKLTDVAAAAGVHPGTASRALNPS